MTIYAGFDVLDQMQPSREGPKPILFDREFNLLDNQTGVRGSDAAGLAPTTNHPFIWIARDRTEIQTLKTFILARKGRAVPVWVPTYQKDFQLTQDLLIGGATIAIKRIGYASQMFPNHGGRRHVAIFPTPYAAPIYRKITAGVEDVSGLTETLTVDSNFPATYSKDTVLICFLLLCRLTNDENTYDWVNNSVVRAELSFTEIPLEAPL